MSERNQVIMFISIAQVVFSIATAAFVLWGLIVMVKGLKETENRAVAKNKRNRSIIILVMACVFYGAYSFFAQLESMLSADYNLIATALRSLLRAVFNLGFLPLLPLVLQPRNKKYSQE